MIVNHKLTLFILETIRQYKHDVKLGKCTTRVWIWKFSSIVDSGSSGTCLNLQCLVLIFSQSFQQSLDNAVLEGFGDTVYKSDQRSGKSNTNIGPSRIYCFPIRTFPIYSTMRESTVRDSYLNTYRYFLCPEAATSFKSHFIFCYICTYFRGSIRIMYNSYT